MANMSYCRFTNTEDDLGDCINALNNREISSQTEKSAAKRMLKKFLTFCVEEDLIEDFSEDAIDELIDECNASDED